MKMLLVIYSFFYRKYLGNGQMCLLVTMLMFQRAKQIARVIRFTWNNGKSSSRKTC
uniref:Uncharacterized protein n=1 Tax=Arundo donax TaxID=35708 RepID=A0A0A8Y032_ARUDO